MPGKKSDPKIGLCEPAFTVFLNACLLFCVSRVIKQEFFSDSPRIVRVLVPHESSNPSLLSYRVRSACFGLSRLMSSIHFYSISHRKFLIAAVHATCLD